VRCEADGQQQQRQQQQQQHVWLSSLPLVLPLLLHVWPLGCTEASWQGADRRDHLHSAASEPLSLNHHFRPLGFLPTSSPAFAGALGVHFGPVSVTIGHRAPPHI
jgi:hypothetical protein